MPSPDGASAAEQPPFESASAPPAWARHGPVFALLAALALHFILVTANGSTGFLAGHEFRQSQTALSAAFIAREDNYTLAYPTPLFGPPWSIPMEFPLFQWGTAWLATHTDWSIIESARALSIACFYLALPGLFLLLREVRPADRAGRFCALVLLLCAPAYIFFTRAVLIESMALMFCLWFLWAFARACRRASWGWALLASGLGGLAALVKVTTFLAWCTWAAVGGILWSWRQWRTGGWPAWGRSVGLGAMIAALPTGLTLWWLHTADTIKATSPGGSWLQSEHLRAFNLGTWADRTNAAGWAQTGRNAFDAVSPGWAMALVALGATWLAVRRRDLWPWAGLAWFAAVPFGFPVLYSFHDYYFYATAAGFLAAAGVVVGALWNLPGKLRLVGPAALVLLGAGLLNTYFARYRASQLVDSPGGSLLTAMIRDKVPADDVIVVIGADWSAAIPYYTEHRALMLRNALVENPAEALPLLDCLEHETVGGLLVVDDSRNESDLIDAVTERLGLDPRPSVSDSNHDFYLNTRVRGELLADLIKDANYRSLRVYGRAIADYANVTLESDGERHEVSPELGETFFAMTTPRPRHYRAEFPFELVRVDGRAVLTAHPDAEIWFTPPSDASEIEIGFGMRPESYEREESRSDGVEFLVLGIGSDGGRTVLFQRTLDPVARPGDRGLQTDRLSLPQPLPAQVVFATLPHQQKSFDWAYWQKIAIR